MPEARTASLMVSVSAFGCLGSFSNRWAMRNSRGSQRIRAIGARYCRAGCGGIPDTQLFRRGRAMVGIWLIALGVPGGWFGIAGPLTITFLILKVSGIPM